MSRHDWYRRTTWTNNDQIEFFDRFKRSRGSSNKCQYLRIQALYLAQTKTSSLSLVALELLHMLFKEYPLPSELASAHLQAAHCYEQLGDNQQALHEFDLALQAQAAFPNCDPGTRIEYPWFVALNGLTERFASAIEVLETAHVAFPVQQFKVSAAKAFIAHKRGLADATRYAKEAFFAAATSESQFRFHRNLGLVGDEYRPILERLHEITAA